MAKKRTMNELRQSKEYKIDPVQQVLAQQIEELAEHDQKKNKIEKAIIENQQALNRKIKAKEEAADPSKYDGDIYQEDLDKAAAEGSTKYFPEKECPLDPVEEAKTLIVDKITRHFSDYLFEMINDEMSNSYVFQVENYLTPAGFDEPMLEEAWFEFFHEHHGDILYEVMQNITN